MEDQNDGFELELKALKQRLIEIEERDQRQALYDAFAKKIIEKNLPGYMMRGHTVTSLEEIDALVTKLEKDYYESLKVQSITCNPVYTETLV